MDDTSNFLQAYNRAVSAFRAGNHSEAEQICQQVLSARPEFFEAIYLLGAAQSSLGQDALALVSFDQAIALRPDCAETFYNRGNVLKRLKRPVEAVASYDRAIALQPEYALAFSNRGNTLAEMKRFTEALASYDRALALKPNLAEALYNRGNALHALKRFDEAMLSYDRALSVRPDYVKALYNRGNTLAAMKRFDEALVSYDRALSLQPNYAEALYNRGNTLRELRRFDEALSSYDRSLSVRPSDAEALSNRGVTLHELGRLEEALDSFERAKVLRPNDADICYNYANTLRDLKRFDEALSSYDRALAANADHAYAFSGAAFCAINLCDWDKRALLDAEIKRHVSEKKSVISPFVLLGYSGNPALQLQCAKSHTENTVLSHPQIMVAGQTRRHDKLRVAYLSADFRDHPVASLIAELFEQHDRMRFDVVGMSIGRDDKSKMRTRLVEAFDEFHDIRSTGDPDAAKLINDLHVDIAVDLTGYTHDSRPGILARRPAPVQASYLGFPATMGAKFVDYIIANSTVLPFEQQAFYTEKIVHLPDCYQVNDTKRKVAEDELSRQDAGLPTHGFVFCCFNNNWKITPPVFDVWMRLLRQIEGSVLWLLRDNEGAERNLRKEAQQRGIKSSRLVFAGRLQSAEHLARHRLADLFLDTLPYNAHTTASDALWVGLPVVTCKGEAFAGRVAASLLQAVGIPELVTSNLEEYQALALKLARDPTLLAEIKGKLERNRSIYPLFNPGRFARHIESAYTTMWGAWQRGEAPKSFSVEPID